MSLFGSILAGGMAGFGSQLSRVAENKEQSEQRQRMEKMRADMEMERQTRLEELRSENNRKLSDQQHGHRMEQGAQQYEHQLGTIAARDAGENQRLDKQLSSREKQHGEDLEVRREGLGLQRQQLGAAAADRAADNRRADEHLKLQRERLEKGDTTGGSGTNYARMDQVDVQDLTGSRQEQRELRQTIRKLQTDPFADKGLLGDYQAQLKEAQQREAAVLKRYGRGAEPETKADPAGAATTPKEESKWDALSGDTRNAMLQRVESFRGKPEFDAVLSTLGSKYGAPKDVLESLRKEQEPGLIRRGLQAIDRTMGWGQDVPPAVPSQNQGLIGNDRAANSAARAAAIKSIDPSTVSPEEATQLLQTYGTEIPKSIRDELFRRRMQ